jgi:hypothetical protein
MEAVSGVSHYTVGLGGKGSPDGRCCYIDVEPSYHPIDLTLLLFLTNRKSMSIMNSMQSAEIFL